MSFPPVITEYGDDCPLCFLVGQTPLKLYVSFGQIKMGDLWLPAHGLPPNGLFELHQTDLNPCIWFHTLGPQHYIWFQFAVNQSVLLFDRLIPVPIFRSSSPVSCIRFHTNVYDTPVNNFFWGGLAYVFTPQEMQDFIESYTPIVDPDPQMNVYPIAGEKIVVQYTDSWGDTNIKMLIDLNP